MKDNVKESAKISYEPEADVLSWEISGQDIDYAKEIGNVVVHFSENNVPVLIEILEATKFMSKAQSLLARNGIKISPAFR